MSVVFHLVGHNLSFSRQERAGSGEQKSEAQYPAFLSSSQDVFQLFKEFAKLYYCFKTEHWIQMYLLNNIYHVAFQ